MWPTMTTSSTTTESLPCPIPLPQSSAALSLPFGVSCLPWECNIMTLWKYNKITGYWVAVRSVTDETKEQWLALFKRDEPGELFKVSKHKPK